MEIELGELDLRYEALRVRSPEKDRRLLASLSELGQIVPIVVVPADEAADRFVLVDGYRRVRALRLLRRDAVLAVRWELSEIDALLLRRSLAIGTGETSLEQAWLLTALKERFGLSPPELARRFDRSQSWVSRRLALVRELPLTVQELIREGKIVAHAAAKHLVPLARANTEDCERLARNIAPHHLSSRDVGELYAAWRDSGPIARERIVEDPLLFIRTRAELSRRSGKAIGPRTALLEDLAAITAIAGRALRRVRDGTVLLLSEAEREEIRSALAAARSGLDRLSSFLKETTGGERARPRNEDGDPRAREEGALDPEDRASALDLARGGAGRDAIGDGDNKEDRAAGEGKPLP